MDMHILESIELLMTFLPKGKDNAIHQTDLAEQMSVKPGIVKRLVRQARREGYAICSNKAGYFLPANQDEKRQFVNMMHKSAISHFASSKGMSEELKQCDEQITLTDLEKSTEGVINGKN